MSDADREQTEAQQPDPDRRGDLAKQALDTGFDDPLWLHNLSMCSRFNPEAYGDLLETAEQLRHDAELLESVHEAIESNDLVPAEAAWRIATSVEFSEFKHAYDGTREDLFSSAPIEEEP